MAKRFIFRQAQSGASPVHNGGITSMSGAGGVARVRKFGEPTPDQIKKAKETWKRLAPKEAKGLLK